MARDASGNSLRTFGSEYCRGWEAKKIGDGSHGCRTFVLRRLGALPEVRARLLSTRWQSGRILRQALLEIGRQVALLEIGSVGEGQAAEQRFWRILQPQFFWRNSSGASLLVLAETPDELPSDCSVSIQLLDDAGRCRVTGWPRTVLADGISRATARQAALRLARFEDPLANAAGLPQTVSLVSLLGLQSVNDICAGRAQQEWQSNSMSAPIGWSDGEIVYLDLPADGPHGLIAGTTGSGKSELMRCLVASLAFTASPEQLNFVLIDYKGGSAFDACAGLPHVVGLVTDLDERLGERALVCLRAELAYREQFLRDAQAASISELSSSRSCFAPSCGGD